MSRSKRKTPIFGNCTAESEKQDKRRCNRAQRRMSREQLAANPEQYQPASKHEALDVWLMNKDGKRFYQQWTPVDMRK